MWEPVIAYGAIKLIDLLFTIVKKRQTVKHKVPDGVYKLNFETKEQALLREARERVARYKETLKKKKEAE